MSITVKFYSPPFSFYGGSAVAPNVPQSLPVSIGGHAYLVDLTMYERETLDALRQAFDNAASPGEQSLSTQGTWRYSETHWEFGAGQTHLDDNDSIAFRFRSSKGVDPWTPRTLRLLPATESKLAALTPTATTGHLLAIGTYFYMAVDDKLYRTSNPSVASPTWVEVTSAATTNITSITTDGNVIYATDGVAITKSTIGDSTATSLSTQDAQLIGFANGWLLAANNNVLYSVDNVGVATAIFTHFNTSFRFSAITPAPSGIFVGGNSADRAEFLFVGFDPNTGGLAEPLPAGELPRGERINAMRFYGGVLLLGTSKGFRVAQIVSDRAVSIAPVILAPGDVKTLEVDGEFVWCGWTNYDSTSTGIGRAWLQKFTEPLVPAYASDLMATTQGTVSSVASFAGKRYFFVLGHGIYGETAGGVLVTTGTIDSGLVRWGSMELKIASAVDLRHDPLNGSVTVLILRENGDTYAAGVSNVASSTGPTSELSAGNTRGESLEVRLTLARSGTNAALGPVLRRWTLRAQIVPLRTDSITVPIIMKTKVQDLVAEGRNIPFDPLSEFLFLKGLESSRTPVIYQEGDLPELVVVDKVMVKPEKWITPSHRWFEGRVLVRLLTVQPAGGS